jgi:hypothetical protein
MSRSGFQRFPPTAATPEGIVEALDALTPPPTGETIVRGYRVKLSRTVITPEEANQRRATIAKVVGRSLHAQRERDKS